MYYAGMKVIKLSSEDTRHWRINVMKLVSPETEEPVRDLNQVEVDCFRELDKRANASKRVEQAVLDEGLESEVLLEVKPVQVSPNTFRLDRTVNAMAVVDWRTIFKKKLLKEHGDFRLVTLAGRVICAVRDPKNVSPVAGGTISAGVPMPDTCPVCSQYAGREAGKHHFICQWNDKAPPEQRGTKVAVASATQSGTAAPQKEAPKVRFLPSAGAPVVAAPQAGGPAPSFLQTTPAVAGNVAATAKPVIDTTAVPAVAPTAPAPPPVPSPGECPNSCSAWVNYANDGKHHHMCQWKKQWEDLNPDPTDKVLVDLETGVPVRPATPEEVAAAAENLSVVEVDGKSYGVVPQEDLKTGTG